MPEEKKRDNRDFRAAFLGAKDERERVGATWRGHEVEIVEPSAKERARIRKSAMQISGQSISVDQGELEVWAIIYCTYYPETGERVFSEGDHDELLELGSKTLDVLADPAMQYITRGGEEEAKN